jgi:hypothetical protein
VYEMTDNQTLEWPYGEDLAAIVRNLHHRVAALESDQWLRQHAKPEQPKATLTTRLHSYKIGEAESVEAWSKGHTLVNPEPSLKEQALADLDALVGRGRSSDTIRRALEQLPEDITP